MNKDLDFYEGAIGVIIVGFILLLIFVNPIAIVGVGERGVKETLGKVSPENYSEGLHFVAPFISHIHNMNVNT